MSKKKDARQVQIRQILHEKGEYKVKDLAQLLEVTPETLRKDLDELEEKGMVVRYHGFVRMDKLQKELPISIRSQENVKIKQRITIRAIDEIVDGNIVYLDAGSTLLNGIDALKKKKDLTIITNSLPMALKCNEMHFDVVLIGGKLQKNGLHTEGYFSEKMLDSIYIDIALFGTDGLMNTSGFTVFSMEEAGTRRHVINQSRKVVMVGDNSKFNLAGHYCFCSFREADVFITNDLTSEQLQQVQACKKVIDISI